MTTNKKDSKGVPQKKTGETPLQTDILESVGIETKRPTHAERTRNLVTRCQEGDQHAFRQLFQETVAGVHRHLSLLIGPGAELDDLIQLIYLNVFNSIKHFRGQSAFTTWLFRITVNVARQEIRVRGRRRRLGTAVKEASRVQPIAQNQTPERQLLVQQQIYEMLDSLPIKKREAYILYQYEGYSLEEIAELLGSSVSTIGSRLQSARKEIMKALASRRRL